MEEQKKNIFDNRFNDCYRAGYRHGLIGGFYTDNQTDVNFYLLCKSDATHNEQYVQGYNVGAWRSQIGKPTMPDVPDRK
jgi:hypothetical protein